MTGIAAIFSGNPDRTARLPVMMAAMAERAKDGNGTWSAGPFALGAAVLHATAESLEVSQPLVSDDGALAVVMDGYLANWEELRTDLLQRGVRLRTRSDEELVLSAYALWGEDCPARLDGEYAFVVADRRNHRIFAARDHQGMRPLHWFRDGGTLLIASDLGPIISALDTRPPANFDFLANIAGNHWFLEDATVWQGLARLSVASWLSFDGERLIKRRHYEPPGRVSIRYRREEDYVEHYREVLFDAVRRSSRSHRPLAVTVSGGLDSSAIFCVAHELEKQGRLPAPGFEGYTLAGEPGTQADEVAYARAATEYCRRGLVEVPLFCPELEWYNRQGRLAHDIPMPGNGPMAIGLERRAFEAGSRAYLTGGGGDQWLDGSPNYYRELLAQRDLSGWWAALKRDVAALGWVGALKRAARASRGVVVPPWLRAARRRGRTKRRFDRKDYLFWLQERWRERLREQEEQFYESLPRDLDAYLRHARLFSPYASLAHDWMGAQWGRSGLDSRNPMLARRFIEFCASTPDWIRNQAGVTKVVHRKAMKGLMPDSITWRTTKADFMSSFELVEAARFCREEGAPFLDELCKPQGLHAMVSNEINFSVDPEHPWEVWGLYAVSEFLRRKDH